MPTVLYSTKFDLLCLKVIQFHHLIGIAETLNNFILLLIATILVNCVKISLLLIYGTKVMGFFSEHAVNIKII